jgi:hypothetical protein
MVGREAVQIELIPDEREALPLHEAIAERRCMFCGGQLPAGYKPRYEPPSLLPVNMPICDGCLAGLAPPVNSD